LLRGEYDRTRVQLASEMTAAMGDGTGKVAAGTAVVLIALASAFDTKIELGGRGRRRSTGGWRRHTGSQ
jgi:hypothetical protein